MWSDLGVAFVKESERGNIDPEESLINLIQEAGFPTDKKWINLLIGWVKEYGDLLYLERLKNKLKKLSASELAIIGGLAEKFSAGDHRWKIITREVQKKLGKDHPFFSSLCDHKSLLKVKGIDPDFQKFGIDVIPMKGSHSKKFKKRERVLKENIWLRNRSLWGSNLRADVASVLMLGLAKNKYQTAKLLDCSIDGVTKSWNAFHEVEWYFEKLCEAAV